MLYAVQSWADKHKFQSHSGCFQNQKYMKKVDDQHCSPYYRPSDRVRLKNANYAIFLGEIVRLERPIVR